MNILWFFLAGLIGLLYAAVAKAELALSPPFENEKPTFSEGASTTRRSAENPEADQDISPPVSATDSDGHRLTYRLSGDDAASFTLDTRTGQLRTRAGILYNYEARDRYTVTIQVDDGHGGMDAIVVVIEVTDEHEPPSAPDAPTLTAATRNSLTVRWTAPENTGPPIKGYGVRYSFTGGSGEYGRLGRATVLTIGALEQDTDHTVQVRAFSAEGSSDWSATLVARTGQNQGPVFSEEASQTRELAENTEAGMHVGAPVTATDAENDRLVYSLEQWEESAFTINSASGQLQTRTGVTYDYETQSEHTVTVRVEDGHGGSATTDVTIAITDVDERPAVADAGWDLTVAAGGTVYLDGTASRILEGEPTYSWALQSWPGDNQPTLDNPTTSIPSFTAAVEGTYVVQLTFSNGSESTTDEVRVTARPSSVAGLLVTADLLVDTNRDGQVNLSDEAGEATWDEASGAVFGPNADDDDEDGVRDGWDDRVNGEADLLDMAPVVVRQIPGLHRNHAVVLDMAYTATAGGPQLFSQQANGDIVPLMRGDGRAELAPNRLVAGDLRLYIDSRLGRDTGFDGTLSLTLTVQESGTTVSQDSVALRGSPILFSHPLQPAERVFVLDIPAGRAGPNTALLDALDTHLPTSVELYRLDAAQYDDDRWVQDFMQTGYVQQPSDDGVETAVVHTQLHRPHDLRRFLPDEYLGPDAGYVYPGGAYHSSLNYGGNVEVIPPHTYNGKTYPFGRIVIGADLIRSEAMVQRQIDFFKAQGVQGPPIVVDVGWFVVAHVDEIFAVLPNRNATPEERPWVIAIASPELAVELLEDAVEQGFGDAAIFEGRGSDETTARELLADKRLMTFNTFAQQKIDTVRDRLIAEVGLTNADFREVPVLVEWDGSVFGSGLIALAPNIANLLVVDDVLFVADPEGPDVDSTDIWQQATLDAVDGLGLETHFVDVYKSYHILSGAAHCGTNVEHTGSTTPWWLNVETEDSE